MRFLIVALLVSCLFLLGILMPNTSTKAQDTQMKEETRAYSVSLLFEEKSVLPVQNLARFSNLGDRDIDVVFSLNDGSIRFRNNSRISRTSMDVEHNKLILPELVSGTPYEESFLTIRVANQDVDTFRVVTLPVGGINNLKKYFPTNDIAVIKMSSTYAVIDESKLSVASEDAVVGKVFLEAGELKKESNIVPNGLCIRTPLGPGQVNWKISNPKASGYSYKPETSNPLVWASLPSNSIDGIYNKYWGCRTALKVPDSCTVDWYAGYYSYCCNAVLAALGYVPTWVTPGSGAEKDWPTCPLQ